MGESEIRGWEISLEAIAVIQARNDTDWIGGMRMEKLDGFELHLGRQMERS